MSLSALGLTPAQERVYRRLTALPDSSLRELADNCFLPGRAGELRVAIAGLRDLGLLDVDPTAASGHRARRPGFALNELIEKRSRELNSELQGLIGTRDQIMALDEIAVGPSSAANPLPSEAIEVLDGLSSVDARIDHLAQEARLTLDTVIPGAHPPGRLAQGHSRGIRTLHRGLRVRCVIQPEMLADEDNRRHIRGLVAHGEQVRVTDQPVERFLIVDGDTLLVSMIPGDKSKGAAVITHPSVVLGYQQLFDRIWRSAAPVVDSDEEPELTPATLRPDDRALLAALLKSPTDAVAASTLAVSTRHLRRRVAAITSVLGARNRFELGALAERFGLLDASADDVRPDREAAGPDEPAT